MGRGTHLYESESICNHRIGKDALRWDHDQTWLSSPKAPIPNLRYKISIGSTDIGTIEDNASDDDSTGSNLDEEDNLVLLEAINNKNTIMYPQPQQQQQHPHHH